MARMRPALMPATSNYSPKFIAEIVRAVTLHVDDASRKYNFFCIRQTLINAYNVHGIDTIVENAYGEIGTTRQISTMLDKDIGTKVTSAEAELTREKNKLAFWQAVLDGDLEGALGSANKCFEQDAEMLDELMEAPESCVTLVGNPLDNPIYTGKQESETHINSEGIRQISEDMTRFFKMRTEILALMQTEYKRVNGISFDTYLLRTNMRKNLERVVCSHNRLKTAGNDLDQVEKDLARLRARMSAIHTRLDQLVHVC
jgi:hypothetical protein